MRARLVREGICYAEMSVMPVIHVGLGVAFAELWRGMAEGLAEYLPGRYLEGIPRDEHGHISIAQVGFSKTFGRLIVEEFKKRTGKGLKVSPVQLGYQGGFRGRYLKQACVRLRP